MLCPLCQVVSHSASMAMATNIHSFVLRLLTALSAGGGIGTNLGCRTRIQPPFAGIIFLLLIGTGIPAVSAPLPGTEPIALQSEKLSFTPRAYYIADVIDERENKVAVAWLLPITSGTATASAAQPVDFKGGAPAAIRQFVQQSLPQNKKLHPLVIRLKHYQVKEEAGEGGRVDGRISLEVEFSLRRDGELVPITEYQGGIRYSRSPQQQTVVEPALRKSLVNALQFLDNWMETYAGESPLLARAVKVSFTDYTLNRSEDTVFYSPQRPLVWGDFKGKPLPGAYAASIMPTFAYDGPTEVIDGIIHLKLYMKVYALRENCWTTAHARNEYGLNHEQRHFDIVRLIAERFKQKIMAKELSVVDYAGIIAYEYIESFREMNKMQEQYDGETRHSLNEEAQERWNKRIDEELKSIGVK